MSQATMPWRAHPPGVWLDKAGPDEVIRLVEFGDEARFEVRAWVLEPEAGVEPVPLSGEPETIDGAAWAVGTPVLDGGKAFIGAQTASGHLCVEVVLADISGRSPDELHTLLTAALPLLDLQWIRRRAVPRPAPPQIERLRPWPLPEGHPLYDSHAVTLVGGRIRFGVALIDPPWATLVGPGHALWEAASEPMQLLHRAVLNLFEDAVKGGIPFTERTVGDVTALAVGPHPLAPAAMLLPDIHLLAKEVLGAHPPFKAIALRRDLLLVTTGRVAQPDDAWLPAVSVPLWDLSYADDG